MKKILYVVRIFSNKNCNLNSKFFSQMDGMKKNGFDVYYLSYENGIFNLMSFNDDICLFKKKYIFHGFYMYDNTKFYIDMINFACSVINKISFDDIYIRMFPFFSNIIAFFKKAKTNDSKIYIEIPTYPNKKERSRYGVIRNAFLKHSDKVEKRISKYVTSYFIIGEDCKGLYNSCHAININNGVSPFLPKKNTVINSEKKIKLIAVGSISFWHGYDRLLYGLNEYLGDYEFEIYIVGNGTDNSVKNMKSYIESKKMRNVFFIKSLYNEELDELFDKCDIAIDTLGFFRKGIYYGNTSLKSREYMMRGIPFIYTLDDNYSDELSFLMKIDNDNTPVDFKKVVSYYELLKSDYSKYSNILRNYAKKAYSWENIYKNKL